MRKRTKTEKKTETETKNSAFKLHESLLYSFVGAASAESAYIGDLSSSGAVINAVHIRILYMYMSSNSGLNINSVRTETFALLVKLASNYDGAHD